MRTASNVPSQPSALCAKVNSNKRDFLAALIGTGLIGGTALVGCMAQDQPGETLMTDGKLQCAESAAALRALIGANGQAAILLGYWVSGDGGGGLFYWDSAAAADDGGTRLNDKAGTTSGWRRIYAGALNVRWFGAKAVAGANDRDAIQAAIHAAEAAGGSLYFPAGTYTFASAGVRNQRSDGANITAGKIELFGDGRATVFKQANDSQYVLSVNRWDGGTSDPAMNATGITIRDISFVGPDSRSPFNSGGDQHMHLVNINAATEVLIENCTFIGFQGDGIYLGSGYSGAERHNVNISIRNCLFDGIDNRNRNGISVIDGDGVLIDGNTFKNCTDPSMPGCIDVEPNGNAYHIVRNIRIINNRFSDCRGNIGNICFVVNHAVFTHQPQNFIVAGNHFEGNQGIAFYSKIKAYNGSTNLIIKSNTGNVVEFCQFSGDVRNVVISDNAVTNTAISRLGTDVAHSMTNLTITGNTFSGIGADHCMRIISGANIVISNNIFSNFMVYAIALGETGCNLAKVSVVNNVFDAVGGLSVLAVRDEGIDGRTCVYMNNVHSGMHSFQAWRTDAPGLPYGTPPASSFTSVTLPDDLPHGINISLVNGDMGVPTEGGNQGTLISHRMSTQPGYEKYTFQHFFHANNTLSPESFYLRRRMNGANQWTPWYKVKGA